MEKHCELLGYSINQKECDVTKDVDFHECENCGEKKPMKKEIKDTGRRKVSRDGVVCSDCGKKASDDQYFRFSRGKCCVCVSREDRVKKKAGIATPLSPPKIGGEQDVQQVIASTCDSIKEMLLEKNRKYGNSALNPVRVFSSADPYEQINVRIDDKLSRLKAAQADEDEDVVQDLIGYLILRTVAKRMI